LRHHLACGRSLSVFGLDLGLRPTYPGRFARGNGLPAEIFFAIGPERASRFRRQTR